MAQPRYTALIISNELTWKADLKYKNRIFSIERQVFLVGS